MTFSLTDKTFGLHVKTASKPFAATCAALSALDPAPYSLPEPPSPAPNGKAATYPAATLTITSLPGCAARPSMDLDDKKALQHHHHHHPHPQHQQQQQQRHHHHHQQHTAAENPFCGQQPDLMPPRDTGTAAAAAGAAPPLRAPIINPKAQRQQLLKAQREPDPQLELEREMEKQLQAAARRRSLHYDRDANRARRNYRPSIDAAAGATVLHTCAATSDPPSPKMVVDGPEAAEPLDSGDDMPGCVPPPAPVPFAAVMPPPPPRRPAGPAAAAAPPATLDWNFGENAQRARLLARYAAMQAAEEVRYDPTPGAAGGDSDSDDDDAAATGGKGRYRRSRSAWKLISSLLSSSKSGGADGGKASTTGTTTAAAVVHRWQEAVATSDKGRGAAGTKPTPSAAAATAAAAAVASTRSRRGSIADDDASVRAMVHRSRDSRRLLRVQRTRVGIDRVPEKLPGRASAPVCVPDPRKGQQQNPHLRQLQSRNSAPAAAMMSWVSGDLEGAAPGVDPHDEMTAAVIAAAAEFAAAEAAAAAGRSA